LPLVDIWLAKCRDEKSGMSDEWPFAELPARHHRISWQRAEAADALLSLQKSYSRQETGIAGAIRRCNLQPVLSLVCKLQNL